MSEINQDSNDVNVTPENTGVFVLNKKNIEIIILVFALLVIIFVAVFFRDNNGWQLDSQVLAQDDMFYNEAIRTLNQDVCESIIDDTTKVSCFLAVQDGENYLQSTEFAEEDTTNTTVLDYEKIYQENPESVDAILNFVTSRYFAISDTESGEVDTDIIDQSLTLLEEAKILEPDNAKIYIAEGSLYGISGQYEEALAAFNKSLELDAYNIEALLGRASAYKYLEDFDNSIADLEKASELDTNKIYTEVYIDNELCSLYTEIDNQEKASQKCIPSVEVTNTELLQDEDGTALDSL